VVLAVHFFVGSGRTSGEQRAASDEQRGPMGKGRPGLCQQRQSARGGRNGPRARPTSGRPMGRQRGGEFHFLYTGPSAAAKGRRVQRQWAPKVGQLEEEEQPRQK